MSVTEARMENLGWEFEELLKLKVELLLHLCVVSSWTAALLQMWSMLYLRKAFSAFTTIQGMLLLPAECLTSNVLTMQFETLSELDVQCWLWGGKRIWNERMGYVNVLLVLVLVAPTVWGHFCFDMLIKTCLEVVNVGLAFFHLYPQFSVHLKPESRCTLLKHPCNIP